MTPDRWCSWELPRSLANVTVRCHTGVGRPTGLGRGCPYGGLAGERRWDGTGLMVGVLPAGGPRCISALDRPYAGPPIDGLSRRRRVVERSRGRGDSELIRRQGPWRNVEHVELATLAYVDWFNQRRLQSELGNIPRARQPRRHDHQRPTPPQPRLPEPRHDLRGPHRALTTRTGPPFRKNCAIADTHTIGLRNDGSGQWAHDCPNVRVSLHIIGESGTSCRSGSRSQPAPSR